MLKVFSFRIKNILGVICVMKDDTKSKLKILVKLIILLISILVMLLIISFITSAMTYFGADDKTSFIASRIINTIGILLVVFLYFKDKFNLFDLLIKQLSNNKRYLLIYMLAGILLGIAAAGTLYIMRFMRFNGFIWQKFYAEDIIPVLLVGIFECFLQTFYEELIYRFAISNIILEKFSTVWAFIFSTIIYVITYTFDYNVSIIALLNIALLNILMLTIYLKYKNIWISVIARTVFEYVVSYVFSINRFGNEIDGLISLKCYGSSIVNGGDYGIYGSIIMTILIILILAVQWFSTQKNDDKLKL